MSSWAEVVRGYIIYTSVLIYKPQTDHSSSMQTNRQKTTDTNTESHRPTSPTTK